VKFSIKEVNMSILSYSDLYNAQNKAKTKDLFIEYNKDSVLTLSKENKDGAISLYKLFVTLTTDDPSEVTFAEEVFGDVGFWLKLQTSPILSSELVEWRRVTAQHRKRKAFAAIIKEVEENGRSSFSAAKYLIEESWKQTGSVKEKRAAKLEAEETAEAAFKNSSFEKDIERLKNSGLFNA
jgi:hypothetical protein